MREMARRCAMAAAFLAAAAAASAQGSGGRVARPGHGRGGAGVHDPRGAAAPRAEHEGGPRPVGAGQLHHRGHGGDRRRPEQGPDRRGHGAGQGGDALRRPAAAAGAGPQDDPHEAGAAPAARAQRPEAADRAHADRHRPRGRLRPGPLLQGPADRGGSEDRHLGRARHRAPRARGRVEGLPRHRRHHPRDGGEPRLRRAAGRLARLAHRVAADAPEVPRASSSWPTRARAS